MNTKINNILSLVVVLLLSVVSLTANATEKKVAKELPIEVKQIGVVNEQPVLQVQFNNDAEEEVIVTLVDQDGTTLYSEKFSGSKYSKKFQFSNNEDGDLNVQLVVKSTKSNQTQSFSINKNTRVIEDVRISKL